MSNQVTQARTAQECMEIAGLDYGLELQPLYLQGLKKVDDIPVIGKEVTSKQAVVRTDSGDPIGVVGNSYELVTNAQAFSFFDGIVEQGIGVYERAYSVQNGARVYVECNLGDFRIGDDDCKKKLILKTSHDGSCAVTFKLQVFRLICKNGLMAWCDGQTVKIRHSASFKEKMAQAREIIGVADQYYRWFTTQAEKLTDIGVTHKRAWEIITEHIHPAKDPKKVSTRQLNAWEDMFNRFESGKGNHGKTYWDLLNGVVEHVDHHRSKGRREDVRYETNLIGSGASLKNKAFEVITNIGG